MNIGTCYRCGKEFQANERIAQIAYMTLDEHGNASEPEWGDCYCKECSDDI